MHSQSCFLYEASCAQTKLFKSRAQTKWPPLDKGLLRHFMAVEGWGRGGGARGLYQTLDSLARSVCDRTVSSSSNQLIILPDFNKVKKTFISVMEGGKALRHLEVFMYMDCKCQHVYGPCVILLLCFTSLIRLFLFFPLLEQTKHT